MNMNVGFKPSQASMAALPVNKKQQKQNLTFGSTLSYTVKKEAVSGLKDFGLIRFNNILDTLRSILAKDGRNSLIKLSITDVPNKLIGRDAYWKVSNPYSTESYASVIEPAKKHLERCLEAEFTVARKKGTAITKSISTYFEQDMLGKVPGSNSKSKYYGNTVEETGVGFAKDIARCVSITHEKLLDTAMAGRKLIHQNIRAAKKRESDNELLAQFSKELRSHIVN